MNNVIFNIIFFLFSFVSIFSQSLWQERNYVINGVYSGGLLEVDINEAFLVEINSEWNTAQKANLNLVPDTKNLSFLTASQESKSYDKTAKAKYKIKDKYRFYIQAQVGEPVKGLYPITAKKSIIIDLKPTQLILSGIIDPKHVKSGQIQSRYISDFKLNIITEPSIPVDDSISLKQPKPEDIKDPNNPPAAKAELSEQEKQVILLKHLQGVLGLLKR